MRRELGAAEARAPSQVSCASQQSRAGLESVSQRGRGDGHAPGETRSQAPLVCGVATFPVTFLVSGLPNVCSVDLLVGCFSPRALGKPPACPRSSPVVAAPSRLPGQGAGTGHRGHSCTRPSVSSSGPAAWTSVTFSSVPTSWLESAVNEAPSHSRTCARDVPA